VRFVSYQEKYMVRTAVLISASLFAAHLLAQEQVYIYVSYKDAKGASSRHKLDCLDSKCKVSVKSADRSISLSDDQKKALLGALQAESKQFVVATDSASSDSRLKVKLRYDTPGKRLEITRRLPVDKPADLAPELVQVIKTHLDLDLSKPVSPRSATGDDPSGEPSPQGQSK